ncbi:ABC transporter permease subunit [Nonomuraea recticatena]|uniref:ABC transporter permease subunit n=1 Tax=Nonomuraea recticatena TaxID=46178 RepID=UPI00360DC99F
MLAYILSGLVTGAVFAVMASGLTLSYAATGVFNFAHGAVGFLTALVFFELNVGLGWPGWAAGLLAVLGFAPCSGTACTGRCSGAWPMRERPRRSWRPSG